MRNFLEENKLSIIVTGIFFMCLVTGWILYALFGHQLIEAMYEGKSIGLLRSLESESIRMQAPHQLEYYLEIADEIFFKILFLGWMVIAVILLKCLFWRKEWLEKHTNSIDAIPDAYIGLWIALAAALGLFTELMIIRIHSSYFQLFAYFKNISLLSCFLGLGIGYARGSRKPLATPLVLPLLALQIIAMYTLRFTQIGKILHNPISEQLALGLSQPRNTVMILFVYCFLVIIFAFNALCFIPLGHLVSRLMMRREKLVSYSWNLIGSFAGILVFFFISLMWLPPLIWITLTAAILMAFLYKEVTSYLPTALSLIIILIVLSIPRLNQFDIFSPYQILTLDIFKDRLELKTSNAYYQKILDLREKNVRNNEELEQWSRYYELPYYFKTNPENVLIIGSGAGNDVASAIRNNSKQIDAIEIDPAIYKIGEYLHPENPYQNDNVRVIINDAREYIQHTEKRYDLIVYGLLDSHTLLTSKSGGIRLDSYVYTVEAFKDARKKLKDDGVLCLTFCIMRPELGRKLFLMLEQAFDGAKPIVYEVGYDSGFAFLASDSFNEQNFKHHPTLKEVTSDFDNNKFKVDVSTDDWPFFYMPIRKYPISYAAMLLLLLAVSMILIRRFVSGPDMGFSTPCFFLGAGFMLIETKGITELSLIYGSSWVVVSIVISAILLMAFLANLVVMKKGAPPIFITYSFLFISVIIGLAATYINLASFAPWIARIIVPAILTLPVFFSGFAFSMEIKKSVSIPIALSSNLLGSMLGGFLEYNSMYFGFRSLYIFALIIYALAFLGSLYKKN